MYSIHALYIIYYYTHKYYVLLETGQSSRIIQDESPNIFINVFSFDNKCIQISIFEIFNTLIKTMIFLNS
jgi:hypothetical protein